MILGLGAPPANMSLFLIGCGLSEISGFQCQPVNIFRNIPFDSHVLKWDSGLPGSPYLTLQIRNFELGASNFKLQDLNFKLEA